MKPYDETLEVVKDSLQFGNWSGNKRYEMLKAMPAKDFEKLRNQLPYVASTVRALERDVKELWTDRNTNYEKLVANPRKHFNDLDIAILEMLHGQDESAFYYRGIKAQIGTAIVGVHPELDQMGAIRKSIKLLKRRGLVQHVLGLFGEDGTAGSGFMENERRYDTVQQILDNYQSENETLID